MNNDSTAFDGDYKNVTEGIDALSRRQLQVAAILARLDACSRTQAVVLAMRQGLLPGHAAPEEED